MPVSGNIDPLERFSRWMKEALESEPSEPTAMSLATVDAEGRPSERMVLLKDWSDDGFVFYTNMGSRKARHLAANPNAALCFHWKSLKRQVRIEGLAHQVDDDTADAYFASRDRGSQIGAWASHQSQPLESRFALEKEVARFATKFNIGKIPRPPFWSGFRVVPERLEFWAFGRFRLHDRLLYRRTADGWDTERLYP